MSGAGGLSTPLRDAVESYLTKEPARFHMPGHKGAGAGEFAALLPWDITEVDGADSLFHADGPILALEEKLAGLYGAKRTLLSAGGATLCIQTMLALACKPGGKVIMSRNIHRGAINACALLDLRPVWIYPETDAGDWFLGRYSPASVRQALGEHPDASAVYSTSPDYFGVMSGLAGIAQACGEAGVPLLVDNAHGAHLKFLPERYGKPHPMDCGAALCCDSLHKTMPAMTGAALLHIHDERYISDAKRVMSLFGSTSPSYPIMLSCETAANYAQSGAALSGFEETARRLDRLRLLALQKGFTLPLGVSDPAKLSLCFAARGMDGAAFGAQLRGFGVEPEYISGAACVLMANGLNRPVDFERVRAALDALGPAQAQTPQPLPLLKPRTVLPVRAAVFSEQETVPIQAAMGRVAASECSPCPPGIPVVMPGEQIDARAQEVLLHYGVKTLSVVKEPGI